MLNWWLKRNRASTPEQPAVRMLTRRGCCLCDEAQSVLESHGLVVEIIDVDNDEQLRAQYTDCVPVVLIDGKVRFRGRVDARLLRRLLNGRQGAAGVPNIDNEIDGRADGTQGPLARDVSS
ncbi:MAG: glutaredoxin family protein [Pirellulales bacterium]